MLVGTGVIQLFATVEFRQRGCEIVKALDHDSASRIWWWKTQRLQRHSCISR